jgi:hypothetical protein
MILSNMVEENSGGLDPTPAWSLSIKDVCTDLGQKSVSKLHNKVVFRRPASPFLTLDFSTLSPTSLLESWACSLCIVS